MPNFGDPLWGEEDWEGGDAGSATPPWPPADADEERDRIKIDQIWPQSKSGGKSQDDSQLVTTIGPPEARVAGTGGMWDEKGNWVPTGISVPTIAPGTTHTEVLTDSLSVPITVNGEWIYVLGVIN